MAENSLYTDPADSQWLYNDDHSLAAPQDLTAADTQYTDGNAAYAATHADSQAPSTAADTQAAADAQAAAAAAAAAAAREECWETDETRLHAYFSQYGQVIECSVLRDAATNHSRRFGFVTFSSVDGVNAVLKEPTHMLDGKQIDPKNAIPRENQPARTTPYASNPAAEQFADPVKEMKGEKIFVGGLPPSATDADLNSAFVSFGNIVETKLMMDPKTGRSRGYGFLEFDSEDAALNAVKAGNASEGIYIHGKRVDVKPAVRQKRNPMMGMVGMPNYGMVGMNNYGMMNMPGYNMMNMPGYNMMGMMGMPGYYGADGSAAEGTDPNAAAAAAAYYAQMGFYGQDGQPGTDPSAPGAPTDQSGDQQSGSRSTGRRHHHHDDRGHRSSRRHDRSSDSRSSRNRSDRGGSSRGSRHPRDREGPVRNSHGSSRNRGHHPY
ncbi:hypothetical protein LPJ79_000691 [Coemansia sp. RSA 1821]|nr:hypothetical protein LPJ79_000691 [Coemansia sp. RSA 1821]